MHDPEEPDLERMRAVIERAVARACPRRFADRRQDIVQAALLKVLEIHRRGEADAASKPSYLWQVAHSATVDEIRRVARRREVPLDPPDSPGSAAATLASPSDDIARRDLGREIQDCLERLDEPRRLAASLHLHGFSAAEAAVALRWSLSRARNLVFRGIGDLRRCLEGKGIHP